jgi:hypothetical protein
MLLRSATFALTLECTISSARVLRRMLSSTARESQIFRDRLAALGSGGVVLRKDETTGLACIELQNSAARNGEHWNSPRCKNCFLFES